LTVHSWRRLGALPRNLSAVAGIVALAASLAVYLRMRGFVPLFIRLPVVAFAGVLMPTLTLATVLPYERMPPLLVYFGMFAANVLVCLVAVPYVVCRNRWLRRGLILAMATALQALIVITIASVRANLAGGFGGSVAYVARHGGELAWLLFPFAVAPAVWPPRWSVRWCVAGAGGAIALNLVVVAGIAGDRVLHPHYATVLYGAFRVAALPERQTVLYMVPAAVALGAGLFAVLGPDPWRRQVGASLLFWMAGGYAGRSPVQLLDSVLSVVLLARAAQAAELEVIQTPRIPSAFGPLPASHREQPARCDHEVPTVRPTESSPELQAVSEGAGELQGGGERGPSDEPAVRTERPKTA
jgi:hypothetical protein